VDIVIESAAGQPVGVEVKASATIKDSDLRGLRKFAGLAQFKMGVLLYDGDDILPLGDNIGVAPLSTLWGDPPNRRVFVQRGCRIKPRAQAA
jgi:predicted AAA+ superfamily ATPase